MALEPLKVGQSISTKGVSGSKTGAQRSITGGKSVANESLNKGSGPNGAYAAIKINLSKEGQALLTNKPPVNDSKVFKSITAEKKAIDSRLADSYLRALSESPVRMRQVTQAYEAQAYSI